ncbi:MAG: CHRD domain-containing protein [Myxococcota bacterium]
MNFSRNVLVRFGLTLALMIGFSAQASYADSLYVHAYLGGPQVNGGAGSGSPGLGELIGSFDKDTKLLSWTVLFDEDSLIGTPTSMHFHGPATASQNAGVQVSTGVAGDPVVGSATLSASQEADLIAGLWYLNMHTTAFPGGEIRGQVTVAFAVPGAGLLLVLPMMIAGGIVLRRRGRRT